MGRDRYWLAVLAALALGACSATPAIAPTTPEPHSCPAGSHAGGGPALSTFDFVVHDEQGRTIYCVTNGSAADARAAASPATGAPPEPPQGASGACAIQPTSADGDLCRIDLAFVGAVGERVSATLAQAESGGLRTQTLTVHSTSSATDWIGTVQSRAGSGDRFGQVVRLRTGSSFGGAITHVGYTVVHCNPACGSTSVVVLGPKSVQIDFAATSYEIGVIWRREELGVMTIGSGSGIVVGTDTYQWGSGLRGGDGTYYAVQAATQAPTFVPNTFSPTQPSAIAGLPQECIYATGCPNAIANGGTYLGSVTVISAVLVGVTGRVDLTLQPEGVILYDAQGQSMGRATRPIIGVLSLSNPDVDPVLQALPWAQWRGMNVHVFLRYGSIVNGTPTYVAAMVWLDLCRVSAFRLAYPTVCR